MYAIIIFTQMLRSVCEWSAGVPLEHSIMNAWIQAIDKAEHFIFIEVITWHLSVGTLRDAKSIEVEKKETHATNIVSIFSLSYSNVMVTPAITSWQLTQLNKLRIMCLFPSNNSSYRLCWKRTSPTEWPKPSDWGSRGPTDMDRPSESSLSCLSSLHSLLVSLRSYL